MLKIGEFSKLSLTTVKALRYYEREGLLMPARVDEWTGYRYYETAQLTDAARIKALRQLDLSIGEIRAVFAGEDIRNILTEKARALREEQLRLSVRLSVIDHILEDREMKADVTVKEIPSMIVYYAETRLAHISDKMEFIPSCGEECLRLNPGMKCADPPYEYCEYPDDTYRERDVLIRHSEAVTEFGKESDLIKFRRTEPVRVLSVYHRGAYEQLGETYAYLRKYADDNGYTVAGAPRECYIDGVWNCDSVEDWLTEIQLPIL